MKNEKLKEMTILDYVAIEQSKITFSDAIFKSKLRNENVRMAYKDAARRAYSRAKAMLKEKYL